MVYASKFRKRRFRKRAARKQRRGGRRRKGYKARLRDKKINTAVERAAKRIAVRTVQENQVTKIFREFFNYPGLNNEPTFDYSNVGAPVDLDGLLIPLTVIPRATISTVPGQAGFARDYAGLRTTNLIKIKGFSFGIRAEWRALDAASANYSHNDLHYAVVGWRSPLNQYLGYGNIPGPVDQNQAVLPVNQREVVLQNHKPQVPHLLPLKPWGYSQILDNEAVPITGAAQPLAQSFYTQMGPDVRKKTFHRGVIRSGLFKSETEGSANTIRKRTKYIKLKKPITMKYVATDPTGERTLGPWQFFLVLRSMYPDGIDVADDEGIPEVCGFIKTHFCEP